MKSKISNPGYHILFWLFVTTLLVLVFGRSWNNSLHAFYFISMLLPVVMATSYYFNYYLVPYFLIKKRYFWFGLYFFYMLVISLYIQMIVVLFSFMYFAKFNLQQMAENITDQIILLAFVMYAMVFAGSILVMLQQLAERQRELELLKNEKKKMEKPFLELMSNRKLVRIPYESITCIESLSDYIKVHSVNGDSVSSKVRIGALEEQLPENFIRIHRSFIVNKNHIARFNNNEAEIMGAVFNISRSYKKQALTKLKS